MSMDATEAPADFGQDQPAVESGAPSPGEATSAPEAPEYFSENFDPQKLPDELQPAYKQMHGAWTRKTQELAEQRQQAEQANQLLQALQSDDENLRNQALDALGFEFADAEPDYDPGEDELLDPVDMLQSEVEQLKQAREQELMERQQQQQYQQLEQHMEQAFADLAKGEGRQFSDKERTALAVLAGFIVDHDQSGMPNIQAAHEWLSGLREEWQQGYVQSKNAPRPASSGQPGVPSFDFDDEEQRINAMASIIEARRSSQ